MAVASGTAALIGAGVSTAGGLYAARKQGKAADRALDQQAAAMQDQTALGREHMQWAKGVYENWRQEFAPVLEELKAEALASSDPDYAAITADTQAAFDSERGGQRREMERYGINPGDGAWGSSDRRMGIGQATAEVNARQGARRDEKDRRFGRLSSVMGIGQGLQQQAMGITAGAAGGLMGAHGQQAGIHGGNAQMHGQAAAGAARTAFGQDWGSLIDNAFNTAAPDEPAPSGGGGGGG